MIGKLTAKERRTVESALVKKRAWHAIPPDKKKYASGILAIECVGDGMCGGDCFCCSDAWATLTADEIVALHCLSQEEYAASAVLKPKKRLTYREWKVLNHRAWQYAVCSFFVQCAERVIKLAPLPEFHQAIVVVKRHGEMQSAQSKAAVKRVYRSLRKKESAKLRAYGSSAIGFVYRGLLHALWFVSHNRNTFYSCAARSFSEAIASAMRDAGAGMESEVAAKRERNAQDQIWKQVFAEQEAKTGKTWKHYKERVATAQAVA